MDQFAWSLALRNLRFGFRQSLLSMGVVAVGVTLVVFLNALIGGLQGRLVGSVTGAIPHVTVRPAKRRPISMAQTPAARPDELYSSRAIALESRKRKIEDWAEWVPRIQTSLSGISAVSPVVEGQAILSRGERKLAVSVLGVLPERHNQVVDIQGKLVKGRFFGLNAGELALGYKLAEELAVMPGDKLRLLGSEGTDGTYTVAGIFDSGFQALDNTTVFLPLRDAQSLFGLGQAVSSIGIKLDQVFDADLTARRLSHLVPYETSSWMQDNQTLLSGLRAQSQSSALILTFTIVGVGFGIASILVMSVLGKQREIGILKAIGASRVQVVSVFALEGSILAFLGSLAGAAQGTALCLMLGQIRTVASATGRMVETFPMDLSPSLVLGAVCLATLVGLMASLYPAWRAARIDPIRVIRGT